MSECRPAMGGLGVSCRDPSALQVGQEVRKLEGPSSLPSYLSDLWPCLGRLQGRGVDKWGIRPQTTTQRSLSTEWTEMLDLARGYLSHKTWPAVRNCSVHNPSSPRPQSSAHHSFSKHLVRFKNTEIISRELLSDIQVEITEFKEEKEINKVKGYGKHISWKKLSKRTIWVQKNMVL